MVYTAEEDERSMREKYGGMLEGTDEEGQTVEYSSLDVAHNIILGSIYFLYLSWQNLREKGVSLADTCLGYSALIIGCALLLLKNANRGRRRAAYHTRILILFSMGWLLFNMWFYFDWPPVFVFVFSLLLLSIGYLCLLGMRYIVADVTRRVSVVKVMMRLSLFCLALKGLFFLFSLFPNIGTAWILAILLLAFLSLFYTLLYVRSLTPSKSKNIFCFIIKSMTFSIHKLYTHFSGIFCGKFSVYGMASALWSEQNLSFTLMYFAVVSLICYWVSIEQPWGIAFMFMVVSVAAGDYTGFSRPYTIKSVKDIYFYYGRWILNCFNIFHALFTRVGVLLYFFHSSWAASYSLVAWVVFLWHVIMSEVYFYKWNKFIGAQK